MTHITDFEARAELYHEALPGIVRASLLDHGLSEEVMDRRLVGWDGAYTTVPVRNRAGEVVFFERWNGHGLCSAIDQPGTVELYPWDAVFSGTGRLVLVEGVHEALVLESRGIPAVSATGTGRFLKCREWEPPLQAVREIVVAYRLGERRERKAHLLSRDALRRHAVDCLLNARLLEWPEALGPGGGAFAYFVKNKHTVEEFEALLRAK